MFVRCMRRGFLVRTTGKLREMRAIDAKSEHWHESAWANCSTSSILLLGSVNRVLWFVTSLARCTQWSKMHVWVFRNLNGNSWQMNCFQTVMHSTEKERTS